MLHIKEKHRNFWKWAIIIVAASFLIGIAIFFIVKFLISGSNDRLAAGDDASLSENVQTDTDLDFGNFVETGTDESNELNGSNGSDDPSNPDKTHSNSTAKDKQPSTSANKSNPSSSANNIPQPVIVKVTSIKVNPTSLTLLRGNTANLTATISPENATDKSISWSSSNADIATVTNGGRVVAHRKGSATITAKTADGGHTATTNITVANPELKVSPWIYPSTITANGVTSQGVATGANASGGSEDYIIKIEVYRNGTLVRTGHNRVDVAGSGEYYAKWTVDDAEEGTRTGTTETVTVP